MGSLRGRGLLLLCIPRHHPDSFSRIVALSHGCFVLSGSFAWWRLLSFPDGLCCIGQGRNCSLGVRAVPFFAGRLRRLRLWVGCLCAEVDLLGSMPLGSGA
jgi:hypothetical protein